MPPKKQTTTTTAETETMELAPAPIPVPDQPVKLSEIGDFATLAKTIDDRAITRARRARANAADFNAVIRASSRIHHGDFDGRGRVGAFSTVPDDPNLLPRIRAFASACSAFSNALGDMLRMGVHDPKELEKIAAALAS
jgi:hypothetical protein